ncbi:retrotransposon protein, putative, ty1-copia subclass, partial [Tanacetum coccineum]
SGMLYMMLGSMTPELHRQFENYSPYDMLQELKSMFEKQAEVERFDLIKTFHACKHEEGKPVGAYVLKMKDYVEHLERLGYVLPQDLSVGLILNGLTSDFTGFVQNYNMHNMGKTIGELHAMLIVYEKGLPKKAETPQVMMIKGGKIQKANKKSLKAKVVEEKEASWLCQFFREARKLKQGAIHLYMGNGVRAQVEAIGSKMTRKSFPHRPERATDLLGIIHTDVCGPLRHVSRQVENQLRKTIKALRSDRGGEYISQEFKDYLKACGIVQQLTPPYTPQHNGVSERRNRTLLDMVRSMMNLTTLLLSFWGLCSSTPATRNLNMTGRYSKQSTTAMSATEAEYIATSEAAIRSCLD